MVYNASSQQKGELAMKLWRQRKRRTSQDTLFSKIPFKRTGIFFNPKASERTLFLYPNGGNMTKNTYTQQEKSESQNKPQLRKRQALRRYLKHQQELTFRRNPTRDLMILFKEYLEHERAA